EKCTDAGEHGRFDAVSSGGEDRNGALSGIADERRCSRPFFSGAQHIRCADIARTDLAHVAGSRKPRENDSKRNRAEDISEDQGCGGARALCRPVNRLQWLQHYRATVLVAGGRAKPCRSASWAHVKNMRSRDGFSEERTG